jgi:adenylate kinase family enzyme
MLIAHISGYCGAGKTFIGKLIDTEYDNITVKDTDDFLLELDYKNMTSNEIHKKMLDKMNKYLRDNFYKNIIFVGIGNFNMNESNGMYPVIKCDNLIWLDTSLEISTRRALQRQIKWTFNNINSFIDKQKNSTFEESIKYLATHYDYHTRKDNWSGLEEVFVRKGFVPMGYDKILKLFKEMKLVDYGEL